MKFKAVGPAGIGFAIGGRDVYPGDVFEIDERTGRTYVASGRAVLVESAPAPVQPAEGEGGGAGPTPPDPTAGEAAKKEPEAKGKPKKE